MSRNETTEAHHAYIRFLNLRLTNSAIPQTISVMFLLLWTGMTKWSSEIDQNLMSEPKSERPSISQCILRIESTKFKTNVR